MIASLVAPASAQESPTTTDSVITQAKPTTTSADSFIASAQFQTFDGCTINNITITATMTVTVANGQTTSTTSTEITIDSFDVCNGINLGTSTGVAEGLTFTGDLSSATLSGTIPVIDGLGNPGSVAVSLTWTGTGSVTRTHTTTRIVTGNVTTTITTKDASRPAIANGSVDGLPVVNGTSALLADASTKTTSR